MPAAQRNARGSKAVAFLVLFVFPVLPLHYPTEVLSGHTAIVSVGKIQLKAILLHRNRFAPGSIDDSLGRAATMNLTFLRTDYKQNLLVWPVIAGDLTRSPPAAELPTVS